ncbi:MAG: methyltransferase domain-containing protein [Candidatus Diapherotrites archaeon]|nr:methyltransferase domain-containing protein [Candidatus Diapherotrites archaeon]
MCECIFLFGRNPKLSYLELASYFKARELAFKPIARFERACLISFPQEFSAEALVEELAGTVKIAKLLFSCNENELEERISSADLYEGTKNKIMYFIDVINASSSVREFFKDAFKRQKLKAVHKFVAPHILAKKLCEHVDIIVIKNNSKFFVAKTIACSDPHKFRERDEERPFVEPEIMSSVRLARILVNLSCTKPRATILDPFCGIGTVLQEAMLLGYNVKGLELSPERAKRCTENLEWIKERFNTSADFGVKSGDARRLSDYFENESIDAIVTEPELGPLLKKLPAEQEAKQIVSTLQRLYKKFFSEAKLVLKPNGKIVIVIPRFRTKNSKLFTINMDKILHENGFRIFNATENLPIKASVPYLYKEEWHKIERLIYVLEKAPK